MRSIAFNIAMTLAGLASWGSSTPAQANAPAQIVIPQNHAHISWTQPGGAASPATEGGWVRGEFNLIDGSGLLPGIRWSHQIGDNFVASNLTQRQGGLVIDLGASYNIGTMQIWALNDWGYFGNFSPSTFSLLASNDSSAVRVVGGQLQVADLSRFTRITNATPLARATHLDTYLGETYSFGAGTIPGTLGDADGVIQQLSNSPLNARYIFLDNLEGSPAFGGRLGFSEIQFHTFTSAVPEPSVYAMGLAGLGALLAFRRRTVRSRSRI